jgi:hypothetical protein
MTEQNPNSNPLDAIKNEISASLNDKNKKTIPWNNIVITAVGRAYSSVVSTNGCISKNF